MLTHSQPAMPPDEASPTHLSPRTEEGPQFNGGNRNMKTPKAPRLKRRISPSSLKVIPTNRIGTPYGRDEVYSWWLGELLPYPRFVGRWTNWNNYTYLTLLMST